MSLDSTVTIPAGQTTFEFFVTPINNNVVDGNVPVVVTATATGFDPANATVTVNNTDVPTLTITSNAVTVAENAAAGTLVYTVTRNTTVNTQPLTVTLTSDTASRLGVGSSVVIPAGATSVTFVGTPVNNAVADGMPRLLSRLPRLAS